MSNSESRRISRGLTAEEAERVRRLREKIAAELPELTARDQLRKEAREETTLSGGLRRAIHGSPLSLTEIAAQIGIAPLLLDEFLTGERTLRSDSLDRLAALLGYGVTPVRTAGRDAD